MALAVRPQRAPRPRSASEVASNAPALMLIGLALVLALHEGGYAPTRWYPAALFVLALGVVAVLVRPNAKRWTRQFGLAVGSFAIFVLWSYASIAWAEMPADAWDAANQTLLFWLAFVVAGLRPWTPSSSSVALGLVAFGVTAIAAALLVVSAIDDTPETLFILGRLSEPTGYANATAALLLIALWPALHLATAQASPVVVRGLALASASLLAQVALLCQSRGALLALSVTTLAYVALTPRRWPACGALAAVALLGLIAWPTLVALPGAGSAGELSALLADARLMIVGCSVAAGAMGTAAALIGRRLWGGEGAPERVRRRGDLALALLVVAGLGVAAAEGLGDGGEWVEQRWQDFKSAGYSAVDRGGSRFTGSLGSGRYDFYRVALNEFRAHPVGGIGAGNFAVPYLLERRTGEAPAHPHSLGLRIAVQLGVLGIILFATFLVAILVSHLQSRGEGVGAARAGPAAGLTGGIFWLVHGMGDWLWEMPALSLLALVLLAVGARWSGGPDRAGEAEKPDRRGRHSMVVALRLAGATLVLVAAATLVPPWLASRYEASASALAPTDPRTSIAMFRRASKLNPLSADPLIAGGVVAREGGRPDLARESLEAAARREPSNWFAFFELGLLQAQQRNRGEALRSLDASLRLNPRQELVALVRDQVAEGSPIRAADVERDLFRPLQPHLAGG